MLLPDNTICFFDSHAQSQSGFPNPSGSAIITNFDSINELFYYLHILYEGCQFNMIYYIFQNILRYYARMESISQDMPVKIVHLASKDPYGLSKCAYQISEKIGFS